MSSRQFWFLFIIAVVVLFYCLASYGAMLGSVGKLISSNNNGGTPPIPVDALVTDNGDPIVTDTGQYLLVE